MITSPLLQNLALPVIGSPLFIASSPKLVVEQCKAGIVGAFPALNARPADQLDVWLTQIKGELAEYKAANPAANVAPFAVNQIVHQSNDRLQHDIGVCLKHQVPVWITSLRAPPKELLDAVHSYGGIVLSDVISIRHAKKALEAGVDGLILVAAGAGGHAGALSPFALLGEVRAFYDGTLVLAGAITKGEHVLAAQAMGADLAYMGTRWLTTQEANTSEAYKQAIVESTAADVIYTNLFTGVHGNYLRKGIVNAGLDPDNLPVSDPSQMNFGNGAAKAWKDIWGVGQGVGQIRGIGTVAQAAAQIKAEYAAARSRIAALP
ncbi:MAG TPA: nitronate monooxygenase family protein [Burkholderiales bacterium]|nr:nitronate monooxygenase family protein [Burkholderiales bacterium]